MFTSVLVANRGEIAVRVVRTLRRLGIASVAVYTDADAGAPHALAADVAVRVPSYLDAAALVAAGLDAGARAVHPGYGFLAENAAFATACADAGLVFVGPPPAAIEAMGDKIRAKQTVAAAGVPVVPGRDEAGLDDAALAAAVAQVGLPVLLKPSAGGGGKGMRLVTSLDEVAEAIASARREARGAFGDDTLLVERFVDSPRHIEVQVFADTHGNVIHLGERECSLQRRHQKIIEEAPSPLLTPAQRERMGASAVAAARSVGYVGAGTVEYIVSADRPDEYFFMEMNTRLQVEHPVTELVTGLDLVELQLRVAAGEPLPLAQADVRLDGHAVEARVYAEDPTRGFLPTGGRVLLLAEPDEVRVDSGIAPGAVVGSSYDPMLAKVVAHGPDRAAALARLRAALGRYTLLGLSTNVAFLRALLAHPAVLAGDLDTGLVERDLDTLTAAPVPAEVPVAAALARTLALDTGDPDPWAAVDGWRLGAPAWTPHHLTVNGAPAGTVHLQGPPGAARVRLDSEAGAARAQRRGAVLAVEYGGRGHVFQMAQDGDTLWLGRDGSAWAVREVERAAAGPGAAGAVGGVLRSPMPGTVLAVKVEPGERVAQGQPVVVVEAMKMEHTVLAPLAGVVTALPARVGNQVKLDETLAEISAEEAP